MARPCESQSLKLPINSGKKNTDVNSTLGEKGVIVIPILQTRKQALLVGGGAGTQPGKLASMSAVRTILRAPAVSHSGAGGGAAGWASPRDTVSKGTQTFSTSGMMWGVPSTDRTMSYLSPCIYK